ncbi:histidine kinase [Streptomyces sp. NBC_01016]|uniref:sensor histidine kinase n=1 Tax=Streptomyces sp. NBC_01016 TaxID=2903720 RepID=UPI00224E6124|nr:histidine kinase [Streptomyces sp. NBC_01016]MCX4832677.1 histidine kinase [Streptomyces sp. NBC_01016]
MDVPRVLLNGPARRAGPPDPGRVRRQDALLAAGLALVDAGVALAVPVADGRQLTAVGWALLLGAHVPLIWRRSAPLGSFLVLIAFVLPYHAMDFHHSAPLAASLFGLFTVAVSGRPRRTVLVGACVVGLMLAVKFSAGMAEGTDALRISGWVVVVLLLGVYVRVHRQYLASVVERAERAERTREEEARRRVAEERLRVARDLHDLLAHSITLVGVQTSVAAHVLNADPGRLDRAAVAKALDDIADTCRAARGELRATLEVLRSPADDARGALPGVDGIPELVEAARTSGVSVRCDLEAAVVPVPAAVGAAAYRIVQEALTNAVRHGGAGLSVWVALRAVPGAVEVSVVDDGGGGGVGVDAAAVPGFGLVGMRERARSVGGVVEAGPRAAGGFEVRATLPLTSRGSAPDPAGSRPRAGLDLPEPAQGQEMPEPAPGRGGGNR